MQIVINISEKQYEIIKELVKNQNSVCPEADSAEKIILKGTPLPKRHGGLIDETELKKELIRRECSRIMYDTLDHTLSYMKPIIEADK